MFYFYCRRLIIIPLLQLFIVMWEHCQQMIVWTVPVIFVKLAIVLDELVACVPEQVFQWVYLFMVIGKQCNGIRVIKLVLQLFVLSCLKPSQCFVVVQN